MQPAIRLITSTLDKFFLYFTSVSILELQVGRVGFFTSLPLLSCPYPSGVLGFLIFLPFGLALTRRACWVFWFASVFGLGLLVERVEFSGSLPLGANNCTLLLASKTINLFASGRVSTRWGKGRNPKWKE